MLDSHIHIERGAYTLDWIQKFVDKAVEMELDEIWLLEHCYRFREFVPMYPAVCAASPYIDKWFHSRAGALDFSDFQRLMEKVRKQSYPVTVRFGLEICYFEGAEDFVRAQTAGKGFDFLLGSTHYIGNFAFDHKAEHWAGVDVDAAYRSYFERSVHLAESDVFDGLAHPDAIKLFGHKPSFDLNPYYEKLANALAASGMYAEENSGIARRCPDTATLGMETALRAAMRKAGVRIQTASDAHCPEDVGDKIKALEARNADGEGSV